MNHWRAHPPGALIAIASGLVSGARRLREAHEVLAWSPSALERSAQTSRTSVQEEPMLFPMYL